MLVSLSPQNTWRRLLSPPRSNKVTVLASLAQESPRVSPPSLARMWWALSRALMLPGPQEWRADQGCALTHPHSAEEKLRLSSFHPTECLAPGRRKAGVDPVPGRLEVMGKVVHTYI